MLSQHVTVNKTVSGQLVLFESNGLRMKAGVTEEIIPFPNPYLLLLLFIDKPTFLGSTIPTCHSFDQERDLPIEDLKVLTRIQ